MERTWAFAADGTTVSCWVALAAGQPNLSEHVDANLAAVGKEEWALGMNNSGINAEME